MMANVQTSQCSFGHAGNVSAQMAWDALKENPAARLIDVRTQPEWVFSGLPNLKTIAKDTLTISWKLYPTMEVNGNFVSMVMQAAPDKAAPLYFLCKTGGRSHDAAVAMTEAGYTQCFNIEDGFEGDRDGEGHRGTITGWKAAKLPWEQA